MLDLKRDYIVAQLARTKRKKYEQYVVTRIVNLVNDWDLKFVTQQYVSRPNGHALTDLFFPQLKLHIEVDEEFHTNNVESDKIREHDIVDATGHSILRVDVTKSLFSINVEIDEIVKKICLSKSENIQTWDLEGEMRTETYIEKGHIDIEDNVAFRTMVDAANCFGNSYKKNGIWAGGVKHPENDTIIWFPKLYPNGLWKNEISLDETVIKEQNEDKDFAIKHLNLQIQNGANKRVVFARVKDTLGQFLYRFRGQYKFNKDQSEQEKKLVWLRTHTKVRTYPKPSVTDN